MGTMRMYRKNFQVIIFIVLLIGTAVTPAAGQSLNGKNILAGKQSTIKSEILHEDRTVYIHCPPGDKNERYPVLYHLDGDYNFGMTAGIVDFLVKCEIIPEVIVVGIGNSDRTRDMTPAHDPLFLHSGGTESLYKFITQELMPYIEKNYPVSGTEILSGHSLGRLFTLYSLLTDPDKFDYYIAASPSIQFKNFYFIDKIEEFFKVRQPDNKVLFMSFADEGNGGAFRRLTRLIENITPYLKENFRVISRHYPDNNHVTSVIPATADALCEIFKK